MRLSALTPGRALLSPRALCASALLAALSPPASAQSKPGDARMDTVTCAPPASPPTRPVAKIYEEAHAEYRKEHYAIAYCGFLEALARERTPQILGNLGRVERKLGKEVDAAGHLSAFLREEIPAADRAEATRLLAEAKASIGALQIVVTAPGAELYLDGASLGTSPLTGETFVSPGHRKIEARLNSASAVREIDVSAGSSRTVLLDLSGATRPLAERRPSAAPGGPLIPGAGADLPGATPDHAARDPARATARRTAFVLGALGVGAAALAVGTVAGVTAFSKKEDARNCLVPGRLSSAQRQCWEDAERDRASWARGATAGLGIGGVAVATGVLAYLLWPSEKPRTTPASVDEKPRTPVASVSVGPSGGGLVLSGSF